MQWSDKNYGGFSRTIPWRRLNDGWTVNNVEAQNADPDSLLNWYRQLINLRNSQALLRTGGNYLPIQSNCRSLYAVLREQDGKQMLVIANLKDDTVENCSLTIKESTFRVNIPRKC